MMPAGDDNMLPAGGGNDKMLPAGDDSMLPAGGGNDKMMPAGASLACFFSFFLAEFFCF